MHLLTRIQSLPWNWVWLGLSSRQSPVQNCSSLFPLSGLAHGYQALAVTFNHKDNDQAQGMAGWLTNDKDRSLGLTESTAESCCHANCTELTSKECKLLFYIFNLSIDEAILSIAPSTASFCCILPLYWILLVFVKFCHGWFLWLFEPPLPFQHLFWFHLSRLTLYMN